MQITISLSLSPWNDFEATGGGGRRFRLVPMFVVLGIAQMASIAFTIFEIEVLMVFALALYSAWLGVQLWGWWLPYLFGASERHQQRHAKYFGRTYTFLPAMSDHPTPDAMHTVLHGLLAGVVATTAAALTN